MSCSALTALDLSGWDTSNMRDIFSMSYIFYSCSSLKSLNLSGWTTPDDIACPVVTFTGCVRLQKVTVSPTFVFFYQYDIERILPEPSPEYITGADGKWYDTATGIGYTPMELCDVSRTGDVTYTAIKPQA